MKGIILAGGRGSRLYPLTITTSKQLLPIYNKPMIYYPLSMLMLSGIREIMVISNAISIPLFKKLLLDGNQWGIHIDYALQEKPEGIAQAFIIADEFIENDTCCLVLGDNFFFGNGMRSRLSEVSQMKVGAHVFAYQVSNPQQYGVIEFASDGKIKKIEEKPEHPKSNYAIPGIYFADKQVSKIARSLTKSSRGEYEITDVIRFYLEHGQLEVSKLGRGIAWFDAGTHESLIQAGNFVYAIEERQGQMVSSPDEIAFRAGWIDPNGLQENIQRLGDNDYTKKLAHLLDERE